MQSFHGEVKLLSDTHSLVALQFNRVNKMGDSLMLGFLEIAGNRTLVFPMGK